MAVRAAVAVRVLPAAGRHDRDHPGRGAAGRRAPDRPAAAGRHRRASAGRRSRPGSRRSLLDPSLLRSVADGWTGATPERAAAACRCGWSRTRPGWSRATRARPGWSSSPGRCPMISKGDDPSTPGVRKNTREHASERRRALVRPGAAGGPGRHPADRALRCSCSSTSTPDRPRPDPAQPASRALLAAAAGPGAAPAAAERAAHRRPCTWCCWSAAWWPRPTDCRGSPAGWWPPPSPGGPRSG